MLKPLTVWITTNCGKFFKRWEYQTTLTASWETYMQVKKQQLKLDMEQQTGSKLGKDYVKAVLLSPCLFKLYAEWSESEVAQSCPTLCEPMDCSLPDSSVHGISQARILEWVAISFSSAWKWKVKVKLLSLVRLFTIPWTAAYQAPPSMGFSRQEYWSGVPLPSPRRQNTSQKTVM